MRMPRGAASLSGLAGARAGAAAGEPSSAPGYRRSRASSIRRAMSSGYGMPEASQSRG
jgi:hypothetical protein